MYTAQTTFFYKEIQKLLRKLGYTYKRSKASALEDLRWEKGDKSIILSGWHGDGNYGEGRIMMNLYVNGKQVTEHFNVLTDVVSQATCIPTAEWQANYKNEIAKARKIITTIA